MEQLMLTAVTDQYRPVVFTSH